MNLEKLRQSRIEQHQRVRLGYVPGEARDADGKWTTGGDSSGAAYEWKSEYGDSAMVANKSEEGTLNAWLSDEFEGIQEDARRGTLTEDVINMDKIIDRNRLKSDVVVYRGIEDPEYRAHLEAGGLRENGFSSWTSSKGVAQDAAGDSGFIMRTTFRKGQPVLHLGGADMQQFVTKRGTLVRVHAPATPKTGVVDVGVTGL